MKSLWHDFRNAARALSKHSGFSAVLILTLALGIGANVSIFTVVNSVLLRPLPYRDPGQLAFIWDRLDWIGVPRAWVSPPQLLSLRQESKLFEGFSILRVRSRPLTGEGDPEQVQTGYASANLFELLGVRAALGRTFAPGEDDPGAEPVAILSHGLWSRRFGGQPSIIGRSLEIDGQRHTVVGVLPAGFDFQVHASLGSPSGADLWTTYRRDLTQMPRGNHNVAVLGRIRPGTGLQQAQAELDALGRREDQQHYGNNGFNYQAVPVHGDLVKEVRPALWVLLGAVALVLLIAVSNIATILLARAQRQQRELALRKALGATQGRIVQQQLVESLLLSLMGGAAGLGLSLLGVQMLLRLAPEQLPLRESVVVDASVLLFALAMTAGTGLACGLASAFQGAGAELTEALREGGRTMAGARRASRLRSGMVVAEMALSLMLLTGAGLLMRSFWAVLDSEPGFQPSNLLTFSLTRQDTDGFHRLLRQRLEGLPGVESVGASQALPLSAGADQNNVSLAGQPESGILVDTVTATSGYFRSLGIALVEGREFDQRDREDSLPVAIIDQSLALRFWPADRAVGKELQRGDQSLTVVGVVRHARLYRVYADDRPQVYRPYSQRPTGVLSFALRGTANPEELTGAVRAEVGRLDPFQPIFDVQTMQQRVDSSIAERRFSVLLMMSFAVAALFLAALGIFGVLSYLVALRRNEIGIRMALGAGRSQVVGMVIGRGLILVAVGCALGLAGALGLSRFLSGLLEGISATDPMTFLLTSAVLGLIALLSCYLPARRAAAVDPIEALRCE